MQEIIENENKEFKPKIVAFCCNWCSYAGADLAGSSRLSYPADVKIIRVPCSCRVNPMFILRGVPARRGRRDYSAAATRATATTRPATTTRAAGWRFCSVCSTILGIESERTRVEWVSAAEGAKVLRRS